MADETYDGILARSWDEIPHAKPLPNGTWRLKGKNAIYIEPKDGKDPKVVFFYKADDALDDVDESEVGALGADYDLANNNPTFTIFINNPADWEKVEKHLDKHMGYERGVNIGESLKKKFGGSEILAYIKTRTFTDQNGEMGFSDDPSNFMTPEE